MSLWFPKHSRIFNLVKQRFWTSTWDGRSDGASWHWLPVMTSIALDWIYPERRACRDEWNEHALRAREFNKQREQKQTGKLWHLGSPSATLQSRFCCHVTVSLRGSSFCLRSDQAIILHTSLNTGLLLFPSQFIMTKANSICFLLHLRRKWIPTNYCGGLLSCRKPS